MPLVRWQPIVDLIILAVVLYGLLVWSHSARALRFVVSAIGFHVLALVTNRLGLIITPWILDGAAILTVLLLITVFQTELRQAFMRLDRSLLRRSRSLMLATSGTFSDHEAVARAAFALARNRLGALFVVAGRDSTRELIDGGLEINADVSPELLEAIFQHSSPLHDGAVLIEDGRVSRAGGILPLTNGPDLPTAFGTRHRAALGLVERCDAMVTVVSEERSQVAFLCGRTIEPMDTPEQLAATLDQRNQPQKPSSGSWIRRFFFVHAGLKAAALGLAGLVWGVSVLAPGATIRTLTVPIEFGNVPQDTVIATQSTDLLAVQIRGSPWILDTLNAGAVTARFDLKNLSIGWHSLPFQPDVLKLPPGITVDQGTPRQIVIHLERSERETTPKD